MKTRFGRVRVITLAVLVVGIFALIGTAAAQKSEVPKEQNRLALGEEHVKQLLLLMNSDAHGMVSKQEYMKFMEAEFRRLDKGNSGELNARQLTQSGLAATRFTGK